MNKPLIALALVAVMLLGSIAGATAVQFKQKEKANLEDDLEENDSEDSDETDSGDSWGLGNQGRLKPYALPPLPAGTEFMEFDTVERGTLHSSTITEKREQVIQNQADWKDFYQKLHDSNTAELPEIDFNSSTVIAVALGQKPTPGYGVSIARITEDANKITVYYRTSFPWSGAFLPQVITYPYHIVETEEKISKAVEFKELSFQALEIQKISVEFLDGSALIQITYKDGTAKEFTLELNDREKIIEKISEQTGWSEEQIRELAKFGVPIGMRNSILVRNPILWNWKAVKSMIVPPGWKNARVESDEDEGTVVRDMNLDMNLHAEIQVQLNDQNKIKSIRIIRGNATITIISEQDANAFTTSQIEFEDGKLYIQKQNKKARVKVLPEQASENAKIRSSMHVIKNFELTIDENGKAVYEASGVQIGKFFGIFPVRMDVNSVIDAESGELKKINRPFWHFLVWG